MRPAIVPARRHRMTAVRRSTFLALVAACGAPAQVTDGPNAAAVFAKVWTVPLSQYAQSNQYANSVTQLSNGVIVAAGADGYQPNACAPNVGGAWLIAVTPAGGNVWQKLYSTCASDSQVASVVRATRDGGLVLAGSDLSNAGCGLGCVLIAKLTPAGALTWQHDLTNVFGATLRDIRQTADGGYIAAGNVIPADSTTFNTNALLVKLSAAGAIQWARDFDETAASFPGAVSGGAANFSFGSVAQTSDGGYVLSGTAETHFATGYANALVVLKVDARGNSQWQTVYYSGEWGSAAAGDSLYRIFPANGGYVIAGAVETLVYPFARLFLLMQLDAAGNPLWQYGYGGVNGLFNVNLAASASATSDAGYLLAGLSDAFLSGPYTVYTGWMLKTDGAGNIQWQNAYTGTTSGGQQFNDVIQTADGGYAAAGYSYVGSGSYGGPGFFVVKTDANGRVGGCSCVVSTSSAPQTLDLVAYPAAFIQARDTALSPGPVSLQTKLTSVKPVTLR